MAVQSINFGMANSPKGTAKNRKPSGKAMRFAAGRPIIIGTATTSMATKANWVTTLMAARSPSSQAKASPTNGSASQSVGRGAARARA